MGRVGSRLGTDGNGCRDGTRRILTPNEKKRVRENRKYKRRRVVGLRSNIFVEHISPKLDSMNPAKSPFTSLLSIAIALIATLSASNIFAQDKKPNILFIMGDDIGWMQPSCYHRGLMVGETPNIDRIAKEGGMFMHYYAESSCTAGRNAVLTGMRPYRAGMLLPQLPGAISYLHPGTPALAKFLLDLGYTTGEF